MRNAKIEMQDGTFKGIKLAKTINVIAVNEMLPLLDGGQLKPDYSWEWLCKKVLELNQVDFEEVKDFDSVMKKVKASYQQVKHPNAALFNPQLETYRHPNRGPRILKMTSDTPQDARAKVERQKKERILSGARTHNLRTHKRDEQIGYDSKDRIDYKED